MRPSFPSRIIGNRRCCSNRRRRRPKTATIALLLLSALARTPPRAAAGFVAARFSGRRLAPFFPRRQQQQQQMASSPSSSSSSTSSSSSFGDHCSVGSPHTHFCCSAYDERSPAVGSFFALHNAAGDSSSKSSDSPFIPYSTGDDRFPATVPQRQSQSRKRPRTTSSGGDGSDGNGGEGGGGERRRPPPPTHFVAVRVDRPEIIAEVERVQAAVVQRHKRLDHIMVPPSKLHVTLGAVLHCHGEGQVQRAITALEEVMHAQVRPYLTQANGGEACNPTLRFPGLGAFGSRVLYVRACAEHGGTRQLQEVSRMIWARLHAEGLTLEPPPASADGGAITLHGTVAKGSRMGRQARFYQIRREHWAMFERWNLEDELQLQNLEAVQLLRMRGDPNNGFYEEEAAFRFVVEEGKEGGEEGGTTATVASVSTAAAAVVKGNKAAGGEEVEMESQQSAASTVVASFRRRVLAVERQGEGEEEETMLPTVGEH